MKNPFRHETLRSQLVPADFITRLREHTIPHESIFNWVAPMEGYQTFAKELFVGDKEVVAKIQGNRFQLMPIGIWPVKGKTPTANAGLLYRTVEAEGTGSRVDIWYRTPLIWTIFVTVFFLVTCLFSLLFFGILAFDPQNDHPFELIALIVSLPTFALVFAALGLAAAWQQSEILRRFLHEMVRKDAEIPASPGGPMDAT
jgi:hypothetical protein